MFPASPAKLKASAQINAGVSESLTSLGNPGVLARPSRRLRVTNGDVLLANRQPRRLQTIANVASGAVNLSQFDYTYDAEGEVKTWSKVLGGTPSALWFEYDNAQQLLSARL